MIALAHDRWRPHLDLSVAALVAGLTALVFMPAVGAGFINYDDAWLLTDNAWIMRGLTIDGLVHSFTTREVGYPKPLTLISWMVDVELYGTGAWGFHLTNVLLHALNAVLVYWLFRLAGGSVAMAAAGGLLWALHPLRVESVAWISQRKDVLSVLFALLTCIAWVHWSRWRWPAAYLMALLAAAASLLAKPTFVTAPLLLLLLDAWPLRRWAWDRWTVWRLVVEKVPFAALVTAYLVWMRAVGVADDGPLYESGEMATRMANAIVSIARYLEHTLRFDHLAVLYPFRSWSPIVVIVAGLGVAGLTAVALRLGRRRSAVAVGWSWFLLVLSPMLGLEPFGPFAMADRFTYLPSLGLVVAVVFGPPWRRWCGARGARRVLGGATALVLVVFAVASVRQAALWRDQVALLRHAVAVTGPNPLAWSFMARPLFERGEVAQAGRAYREAVRLVPDSPQFHVNLAGFFSETGQLHAARHHLEVALALYPYNPAALNALGLLWLRRDRPSLAAASLLRGLLLAPDDPVVLLGLAVARHRQGDVGGAVATYRRLLAIDPDHAAATVSLARLERQHGAPDRARRRLAGLVEERPGHAWAWIEYGVTLGLLGHDREAIGCYRRALAIDPALPVAHNNLGSALARQGRYAAAAAHFRAALELEPGYRDAAENLARLEGRQ